jgi:hypothetical protein
MTGWRALLEYQAARFPPESEGFSFELCLWIAESRIFCGYCAKGHLFCVFGSSKFPNAFKEKQDSQMQTQKKSSQYKHEN